MTTISKTLEFQPIRLGLVGYGADVGEAEHFGGGRGAFLFHLASKNFPGVAAAAVADTSPAAREAASASAPSIKIYERLEDLISSGGVDALIVATPAHHHAPLVAEALRAGIHVLSEIPVAWTIEETKDLWQTASESRALYMAGANPNFSGYIDAAVGLQRQGLLGDPIFAEAEYVHDIRHLWKTSPWRATVEPIRYCTHSLGPLLRLIKEDLTTVSCFSTGSHVLNQPGQHDFMSAQFQTASGVVIRLMVSFINEGTSHHYYRVYTTKGVFERSRPQNTSADPDAAGNPRTLFRSTELPMSSEKLIELPISNRPPAYERNPKARGHEGVDYAMLDAFFLAIRSGAKSPVSLREGLRMSIPGIFAAESARRGGEVMQISYPWTENVP